MSSARSHAASHLKVAIACSLFCMVGHVAPIQAVPEGATTVSSAPSAVIQTTGVFSSLKVYPNPWRSDKHPNQQVTFGGLPAGSTVKIFTTSGHWVKTLPASQTTWDRTNDQGETVASGVYLYLITTAGSDEKAQGKIILIK